MAIESTGAEESKARRARWIFHPLTSAAIVFFACLIMAGGHLYSPDEEILFRLTEAIATRGEMNIEPLAGFATREGRGGLQYPQYPPLQAALAVPLYGLARLTRPLVSDGAILRRAWETTQYHDFSADAWWNRFWVALLFNALVTALTAALLWSMARRLAGGSRAAASATALLYGLATLALPHSRTFFTEPLAALWLTLALAALLRWQESQAPPEDSAAAPPTDSRGGAPWRWALAAGLAAAAGVWTRVDFPLFLPGISLGVALLAAGGARGWRAARPRLWLRRESLAALIAYGAPLALALAGWALFNRWRFGGVAATGYEDQPESVRFATPLLIGLHGFLASPGKGMFFFSPPLFLALFGWGRILKGRAAWGWAAALSTGIFFLFMCKWQNWAGGWCWGPRHIFQIHAPLALGLAPLAAEAGRSAGRRAILYAALILGLGVQVFGCSQSFIDFYQVFYRPPQPEWAPRALYAPEEIQWLNQHFRVMALPPGNNAGAPRPVSAGALPAPINDSIYVPQNTQWYFYPVMLRAYHMHDFLWLRVLSPAPSS